MANLVIQHDIDLFNGVVEANSFRSVLVVERRSQECADRDDNCCVTNQNSEHRHFADASDHPVLGNDVENPVF